MFVIFPLFPESLLSVDEYVAISEHGGIEMQIRDLKCDYCTLDLNLYHSLFLPSDTNYLR